MADTLKQLVWKGRLQCADSSVDATAALVQCRGSRVRKPPWAGGALRLLRRVSLGAVPAVFLSSTHFTLYINALDEASLHYVNGMVEMLVPHAASGRPQTAVLSRIEADSGQTSDPFAVPSSDMQLPGTPSFALVYLEQRDSGTGWQLALHLLNTPQSLEQLSAASVHAAMPITQPRLDSQSERGEELSTMRSERAYLEFLERRISELARLQKTGSAGTALPTRSGALSRRQGSGSRHRGRMSLRDVELLGHSNSDKEHDGAASMPAAAAKRDLEAEQLNKKMAKQLIISSLKERGIGREHSDFAALWSQIYRSFKFALRDKIDRQTLTARELKTEVDKHANFYCNS
ncbi:hypothetical protein GQ54DRAFT_308426 [Martensiomyces pterosporus]|nr:hypothetical protein GQ54DRAFT_308426 [Martensiomyces pterosporus]